jgi:hypothetical protein
MANASLLLTFKRAAQGGMKFSLTERALFMACEFWTAVCSRKLAPHLGVDSIDALRYMGMIYAGIGADGVASALIAAVGDFEHASHPQDRHRCLASLQERLLKTREPVDQLVARAAEKLGLGSGSGSGCAFAMPALR